MQTIRTRALQRLIIAMLLWSTLTSILHLQPAQAAPAAAQNTPPPIQLRTLTNINIAVANLSWSFVGAQDNWLVYETLFQSRGGEPQLPNGLVLRDSLTGREINIHTAGWYDGNNYYHYAVMSNVSMHMPYLLWRQGGAPTGPPDPDIHDLNPSTYDCTICYYDFDTGTGGRATTLENIDPDTHGARLTPLNIDTSGRALLIGPDQTSLWLADLQGFVKKQIYTNTSAIQRAAGQTSGIITAWSQHTADNIDTFLLYNDQTGQVQTIPVSGRPAWFVLTLDGIFWVDNGNITRYDVSTRRTQTIAGGLGVVDSFDVFGDNIAWIAAPHDGSPTLLTVWNWDRNQPVAQTQVSPDGGRLDVALDGSQVVVSVYRHYGVPGMEQAIKIGWLPASADPAFGQVWDRADKPVAQGTMARPWLWGPGAFYLGWEPYTNSSGEQRQVVYYDKSRMEINQPSYDPAVRAQPYYVSNGLLVDEMISGEIRVGDTTVITARVPCTIPVAGDPRQDNPLTPDYATLVIVASLHGEHQAPDRRTQPVNDAIDRQGAVTTDPAHGTLAHYAAFIPQTGHNIPDVFWTYMNEMQSTYGFDWTFVLGYPLTEGYWTQMRVGGKDYPVLIQAFQRRVLTYAPDFPAGWRLQQGNVGQHYFDWRYTLNAPGSPAPTR